ncbi:glycosyltransferase [Acidiphilium iwatense]|uniref:Glycosyltransferase n=1 Tax=Acidiphilium iwatense TaxID=768198 RepID=A0ABS9DX18_9PROT|nr:glycosyltransferase [Acidiphilium iwatense]
MPKTAVELLRGETEIDAAWAVFDAEWYLATYPEADHCCGSDPGLALDYYLRFGCRLGHSPSPLFDELFYLNRNPDVAALIRAGQYRSGFDHYCQHGYRGLSPHWLFDDALYGRLYEDMTLDNLDRHRCFGRYDHWLKSGQREARIGHFMFDPQFYRARAIEAGADPEDLERCGPFAHYLYALYRDVPELAASPYFAPDWYAATHDRARAAIAAGIVRNALHHYVTLGGQDGFDPVPEFSESYYRDTYPDIRAAIEAGHFPSGYRHFVQFGAFELRRPRGDIDLLYYRDMNPRVRDDLNAGHVRDAFAHLRMIGLKDNLVFCPPERVPDIAEPAAKQLFELKARNQVALFARRRLNFAQHGPAALAVVMVLFNRFELTMLALASLRDNYADDIELIIIDNASTDDTRRIETYVMGATIVHSRENLGFLKACNRALELVTAPALLYLNNDIELGHGAIAAALDRLETDTAIGAVGGKVIRTHGRLQEAGSIIWADGSTIGYLRDASPLAPEANFVRDVDYCSGVFLLCRTDLIRRLGGFDEAFSPAYYEEVDLCVRMIEGGHRIVYDPDVVVHHLEFGSAANTEASMALMRRGRRVFKRKHAAFLKTKFESTPANIIKGRALDGRGKRVLFLEDTVPVRRLGSGFVRSNDAVRAIAEAGWRVSVLPVNGARHDIMSLFGDLPDTVEVLHDRTILTLPQLLEERQDFYDAIWISRTHNLDRTLPIFREAGIDPVRTPFVLDTEAIVAARDAASAAVGSERGDFDLAAALQDEFRNADVCRHVTAVNQAEAAMLRELGLPQVSVLGTIRDLDPTPRGFSAREGILFIASIHRRDSPNFDSLRWYRDAILPALIREMGTPPKLIFIGYTAPDIDLSEFADNPHIEIRGSVDDIRPAYNSHRVFIAPTRFAAGTPYKVYETASFGLPCVATDLLIRQLGWDKDAEIAGAAVDDARGFAREIARLYCDEETWRGMREAALRRLERENTRARFDATVKSILDEAGKPASKRRPYLRAVS